MAYIACELEVLPQLSRQILYVSERLLKLHGRWERYVCISWNLTEID